MGHLRRFKLWLSSKFSTNYEYVDAEEIDIGANMDKLKESLALNRYAYYSRASMLQDHLIEYQNEIHRLILKSDKSEKLEIETLDRVLNYYSQAAFIACYKSVLLQEEVDLIGDIRCKSARDDVVNSIKFCKRIANEDLRKLQGIRSNIDGILINFAKNIAYADSRKFRDSIGQELYWATDFEEVKLPSVLQI